jgi:hypothetical protein
MVGERGTFRMVIAAFEDGREIVFFMYRTPLTPADWLDACPRSDKNPNEPRLAVALDGVGDVSRNAVYEGKDSWWTSISIDEYVRLRTLRFDVCGSSYVHVKEHEPRIALHARMASERAAAKNQEEAALPTACQSGRGAACTDLGALARDPREQRSLYERACDLGDLEGCSRLADRLLQGKGGSRDPGRALRILDKKGHDGACLGASRAVIGLPSAWPTPAAEPRYRQGAAHARRACELGGSTTAVSCLWAAKLFATGFGVAADAKLVDSFADRSCRQDFDQACRLRANLVACAKGSGDACVALAEAERKSRYRLLKDDGKEALWRLAACRRGHTASCTGNSR